MNTAAAGARDVTSRRRSSTAAGPAASRVGGFEPAVNQGAIILAIDETQSLPHSPRPPGAPAVDHAYRYLKHLIVTLSAAPGAIITEMMVASAVGLSRTPIREAFLRLQGEKLVQLVPRSGAIVAPIHMHEIRELNETRALIERHAAQAVCDRGTPVEPALRRLIELQREASEHENLDLYEILDLDRRFHQALVAAIENREMAEIYHSFGDRQIRSGIAMFQVEPARVERALHMHDLIVSALAARDAERAKELIDQHLLDHLGYLGDAFAR